MENEDLLDMNLLPTPQMGETVGEDVNTGTPTTEDIVRPTPKGTETTALGTGASNFMNTATMGLNAELNAGGKAPGLPSMPGLGNAYGMLSDWGIQGLDRLGVGGPVPEMALDAQGRKHDAEMYEAQQNIDHPKAALTGSILGALPQVAAAVASKKPPVLPKLAQSPLGRTAAASGIGAVEGGLFAANEAESVTQGFINGGAFGVLAQLGLGEVVPLVFRGFKAALKRGDTPAKAQEDMYNMIIDKVTNERGIPREAFPAAEFKARLKALGPDATMADTSEVLGNLLNHVAKNPRDVARLSNTKRLLKQRSIDAPEKLKTSTYRIFKQDKPVPIETIKREAKEAQKALGVPYKNVFKNTDATFDTTELLPRFKQALMEGDNLGEFTDEHMELLKNIYKPLFRQGQPRYKDPMDPRLPRYKLNAKELHRARIKIDDMINDEPTITSLGAGASRNLKALRRVIGDALGEKVPDIKPIDAKYASAARAEGMYKTAAKWFKSGKGGTPEEIAEAFYGLNPADVPVMMLAAKSAYINAMRANPKAAGKAAMGDQFQDSMALVLGPKAAKQLRDAAERSAKFQETGKGLKKATKTAIEGSDASGILQGLIRSGAIAGGAIGQLSSSLAVGSAATLARPSAGVPKALVDPLDQLFSTTGKAAGGLVDAIKEQAQKPVLKNRRIGGAFGPAAANAGREEDY